MLHSTMINAPYFQPKFPTEDYKPFSPYLPIPHYHSYYTNPASREELDSTPSPHVPNTLVMQNTNSSSNMFEYTTLPATPPDCNPCECPEFDSKVSMGQENEVTNALMALNSTNSPDGSKQEMSPKDDYSQENGQQGTPPEQTLPNIKHEPMMPRNTYIGLPPTTSNGFFSNPFDPSYDPRMFKNPYSSPYPAFPGIFSAGTYPNANANFYNSPLYSSNMAFGLGQPAQQYERDSPQSLPEYREFNMMSGFAMGSKMRIPGSHSKPKSNCICQICGKSYARPSTLKTHMRTHSGERPFKCRLCPKAFTQAANLTAHLRTHSGEKPFSCSICCKRFSQSSSVTTHMRTHSGEKPYKCDYCGRCFSDTSTLTKHKRVHSGEKPYQCKICKLSFSQSGNLHRHMKTHMNNTQ